MCVDLLYLVLTLGSTFKYQVLYYYYFVLYWDVPSARHESSKWLRISDLCFTKLTALKSKMSKNLLLEST